MCWSCAMQHNHLRNHPIHSVALFTNIFHISTRIDFIIFNYQQFFAQMYFYIFNGFHYTFCSSFQKIQIYELNLWIDIPYVIWKLNDNNLVWPLENGHSLLFKY